MANIERLKQLRRVVEAAPDERFHMKRFSEQAPCGTAYCAAGWAAVDPWFRENTEIGDILPLCADGTLIANGATFFRLARLFDIEVRESRDLFAADNDIPENNPHAVTKADVLANIDALIEGGETEPYFIDRDECDDDDDDDEEAPQ